VPSARDVVSGGTHEAIRSVVVVGALDCGRRLMHVSMGPFNRSPHIRANVVLQYPIVIRCVLLDFLGGRRFCVEETTSVDPDNPAPNCLKSLVFGKLPVDPT
jgi:hypothetical protein